MPRDVDGVLGDMGRELKTLSIIGTRPQILKLCPWEKNILYTNQHYDEDMMQGLEVSGRRITFLQRHDTNDPAKTAGLIREAVKDRPDVVIVHGDCFSTLAGALYAEGEGIPLAHIEAGPRCFMDTPEEKIRKKVAKLATWHFCPTMEAVENLNREGITENVYLSGDLLYDKYLEDRCPYTFCTVHRRENLTRERLSVILYYISQYGTVLWPMHPHARKVIGEFGLEVPRNVSVLPPLDYKTTMHLIKGARQVITDSGGIERQAFFTGTPCHVFRQASEWESFTKTMSQFGNGSAGKTIYRILQGGINE